MDPASLFWCNALLKVLIFQLSFIIATTCNNDTYNKLSLDNLPIDEGIEPMR